MQARHSKGRYSQSKDQESLFKAAEGVGNKDCSIISKTMSIKDLRAIINYNLAEFAQDGKATNVINVIGQDGKPVKQYRK
ncbi:MAG: hypothetical protein IPO31_23480 [Candidatus Obscuribacter sp.]|nr:hypothetical protein [Candidatus Obscuribacter sp.]